MIFLDVIVKDFQFITVKQTSSLSREKWGECHLTWKEDDLMFMLLERYYAKMVAGMTHVD